MTSLLLLNSSVLTTFGSYRYRELTADRARAIAAEASEIVSALGHEATAQLMSELLGRPVVVHRISVVQQVGQRAIVLRLRVRAPEGHIHHLADLSPGDYELGLLDRLD